MTTAREVTIQIRAPSATSEGQVSTGYYIVENGVLIMTRPDGEPVSETLYRHTLRPNDDAQSIASVLTRKVRRELSGLSDFNRPLEYKPQGIA